MTKYHIIYADPPWMEVPRNNPNTKFGSGSRGDYALMGNDDIKGLNVQSITEDNAVLFLWTTYRHLPVALEVIKSWGFIFKTLGFCWVKTTKSGGVIFGVGNYTKSNTEICLLATRGKVGKLMIGKPTPDPKVKMAVRSNRVSSVIMAPRGKHSAKPVEAMTRIVGLFGDVSRIELFARRSTTGWDSMGFDVDGLDIRDTLGGEPEL